MAERDRFELDLAAAVRAYLEDAPTEIRPTELARQFATAYPHRRAALGHWGVGWTPALAWVLLIAGLLLAFVVGGLVAGARRPDLAVVIAPSPTPAPAATAMLPAGSMSEARLSHTATLLADEHVLVTGGLDAWGAPLASAEIFDPETGTFSLTGPMTTARTRHTATLLADGRVLVAGGTDGSKVLASAEIYDPETGTFSLTGPMTTARVYHTATLVADGRVLIAGGDPGSPSVGEGLATAEIYDPRIGTFSPTGPMTTARTRHTATLLADGRVLVAGGLDGSKLLASADVFDPMTGTFSLTGPMTTARDFHTATLLADGRVLIAGGYRGMPPDRTGLATAEIYEPRIGAFSPTGPMTTARVWHTATLLPDGRVLIAGGTLGFWMEVYASAELYDPTTGSFGPTGSMTTIREWHTATLLADGRLLVTGGSNGSEADIFDPTNGFFAPAGRGHRGP